LIIEKDDELLIEIEDEIYVRPPPEAIKRTYVPSRQNYIKIVKNCRTLYNAAFDRKGRSDYKRTSKNLIKIARHIKNNHGFI
jgi:hypothetical protein